VRQLIKTILREQVQIIESSDERLEKLIGDYISSSYPTAKKVKMYPRGGNVGITSLTLPDPVDEKDNLIFKFAAYGIPNYSINPELLNSVKSMFGGDKKIKRLIFKWFDKKEVDHDLLGDDLGKQEDNEGAGAYDAPAFEMEPDHTTFKHEQSESKETNRKDLDFFDLVDKGIIFITEPFGNGKKQKSNWEGDSNIITLWNLKHPEKGQEWVFDAIKYPKPEAIQWWNDEGQFTLKDEKYNQILRSIKMYDNSSKQEQKEAELTERCWKGYTQKGMKTMFGKRYPNCVKKK
jgi:hypothetical protein